MELSSWERERLSFEEKVGVPIYRLQLYYRVYLNLFKMDQPHKKGQENSKQIIRNLVFYFTSNLFDFS